MAKRLTLYIVIGMIAGIFALCVCRCVRKKAAKAGNEARGYTFGGEAEMSSTKEDIIE